MSLSCVVFILLYLLTTSSTLNHGKGHYRDERKDEIFAIGEDNGLRTLGLYRDRIANPDMTASIQTTATLQQTPSAFSMEATKATGNEKSLGTLKGGVFTKPSVESTESQYQTTTITLTITTLSWSVANNSEALRLGMRTALSNILDIDMKYIQRGIIVDSTIPGVTGFTVYYRVESRSTAVQIDQILSTSSEEFDTTFTGVASANGFPSNDLKGVQLFGITTQTQQPTAAPSAVPTTAYPTTEPTALPTALPTPLPSPAPSPFPSLT